MAVVVSTFFAHERRLVVRCYHDRNPQDPHRAAHVIDLRVSKTVTEIDLQQLGWGRRDQHLPICPEHRAPTDQAW